MKQFHFGVCGPLDKIAVAAEAGCAFLEPGFGTVTVMPDAVFAQNKKAAKEAGIPVLAMNSMLPGNLPLYGGKEETDAVLSFVRKGMERAGELGVRVVVFGSGTARRIPDGMERAETVKRLSSLLGEFCAVAAPYGIRIAVEPLRAEETNWLHTVTETAALLAPLPGTLGCGINPDFYHITAAKEPFSVLSQFKDSIFHLHVCSLSRRFPLPGNDGDEEAILDFLRAVDAADGCRDVSIEGITTDFAADIQTAIPYLRRLAEKI